MVVELRFPERRAPPEPPPSGRTHARALAAVPFFRERARRWGEDGGTGSAGSWREERERPPRRPLAAAPALLALVDVRQVEEEPGV